MEAIALAVAALLAVAGWFWLKRQQTVGSAERRLLQICLGDRAQAERLVDVELARAPGISRAEAVARAVARHHRDSR